MNVVYIASILAVALNIFTIQPGFALDWPYNSEHCYIHTVSKQRVYCKMQWTVTEPNSYTATEWLVYAPKAPDTGMQTDTASRMTVRKDLLGRTIQELSPLHRELLGARFSGDACPHECNATIEYWATTKKIALSTKPSSEPVEHLTDQERDKWLSPTTHYDFESPEFRQWLVAKGLVKKAPESDIKFAWRTYDYLVSSYAYSFNPDQNRCVSSLCKDTTVDCGAASFLFVAVMRANGIPARSLIGRLLQSDEGPEIGASQANVHVIAQFFTKETGWVPVDIANAMGGGSGKRLCNFGVFDGNFLTMHIDPDFQLDSNYFGIKEVQLLQSPMFWTIGQGSLDTTRKIVWKVITQPSP